MISGLFALLFLATSGAAALGLGTAPAAPMTGLVGPWSTSAATGAVDAMLPAGYRNPRTSEHAVAWALSQVGVNRDSGFCLRFVDLAYGRGSGPPSAYLVWTHSPVHLHRRAGIPPRGALVIWSNAIGRGHGHIAISLGDGRMVSTTGSAVAVLPIQGFADSAYYGWMPPYFYV